MVLALGSHPNAKQLIVSFLCKLCGDSFPNMNLFLRHKWTLHAAQFPNFINATNNIIVFQEIISNQEGIPNSVPINTGELAIASSSNYDGGKVSKNQNTALPATIKGPKSENETTHEKKDIVASLDNENNINNAHNTWTGTETGIARKLEMPETKSKSALSRIRQIESTTKVLRLNKIPPNPCVLLKRLTSKQILDRKGNNSQLKSSSKKMKPINFICPHPSCYLSFKQKCSMSRHFKIVHLKLKQFKCTHPGCPKWFNTKGNCRNHAVIHSSIRYTCDVCKKIFVHKCNLKTHYSLKHTPTTKLFECPFSNCKKSFMTKGNLQCHLPIHMDAQNRPTFECKVCKKQMLRKAYLRQHYLKCHGRSSLHNFYALSSKTARDLNVFQ